MLCMLTYVTYNTLKELHLESAKRRRDWNLLQISQVESAIDDTVMLKNFMIDITISCSILAHAQWILGEYR